MMHFGDTSMSSSCSFGAAAAHEMPGTGERRLSRRYEVDLAIRVRVLSPSTASEWCVGTVLDLSSTGVSFQCHHPFPVNTRIEMVIDWPLKQSALHPICLCASGHVVRSYDKTTAARMTSCRMGIEKASSPPGRV
jgi:PilZ domain